MQKLWDMLESPATDVKGLKRRTDMLIALHLVLTVAALAVLGLVVWRVQHLVTLAQRSNVETLVLGFVVVFLGYVLLTTSSATWGAIRILALRTFAPGRGQRWLQRFADRDQKETKRSYVDVIVRGPLGDPIEIPLKDGVGEIGRVRIELAEIALADAPVELPLSTFQLVAKTLEQVGTVDGAQKERRIVYWGSIEQEAAAVYAAQVSAFDRLAKLQGEDERLWPELTVDEKGVEKLTAVLRDALPALRESMLMPDIEYSAEFSVPVIPEPFAFVQLRRQSQHADPVASMGCITAVALVMLALIALVLVMPPWVPGK